MLSLCLVLPLGGHRTFITSNESTCYGLFAPVNGNLTQTSLILNLAFHTILQYNLHYLLTIMLQINIALMVNI